MKIAIKIFTICFLLRGIAVAANEGMAFLKLPYGNARALVLPYSPLTHEITAEVIYFNPALLSNTPNSFSYMGSAYVEDIFHFSSAYTKLLKTKHAMGIGLLYLTYGKLEGYNIEGNKTEDFSAYDALLLLGYGYNPIKALNTGVALKLGRSKIEEEKATLVAADIGCLYNKEDKYAFAAVIQNIPVFKPKFIKESINLPLLGKLGASYNHSITENQNILGSIELILGKKLDKKVVRFGVGIEYSFPITTSTQLAVRAGVNNVKEIGDIFLLGAGVNLKKFSIDYSYQPWGELGSTHALSFGSKL
jgi:hypothetical protein